MAPRRGVQRLVMGVVGLALASVAVIPAQGAVPVTRSAHHPVPAPIAPDDAMQELGVVGTPDPVVPSTLTAASAAPDGAIPGRAADGRAGATAQRLGDAVREVRRVSTPVPARSRVEAFTIAVTGDVLPHLPVVAAARRADGSYDFRPLLRGISRPLRAADLALCHLEVPLTRDLAALSGYPVFSAPHGLADALAHVGYDGCSVASNHALDRGTTGIGETLRALDRAGLGHAGTARTRHEARRVRAYHVRGRRVAHLSYTYGLNGAVVPSDRPWTVNLIDRRQILRDARRARRHGADLVLVSLHWGIEYVTAPTAAQRRLAGRLLAAPAVDALIGHHAHVVQPLGRRHGKVVAYGLGNLLSNQSAACCRAATQDGVVVRLVVRERRDGSLRIRDAEYVPTMVRHPRRRVVAVRQALRRGASGVYATQLRASLRRTRRAIGDVAVLSD